jgi:hypothetical protein
MPFTEINLVNDDVSLVNLTASGTVTAADAAVTHIDFSTATGNPTHFEGRLFYDENAKALAMYNDEGAVTLQIGQEQWVRVYNNTGTTIGNGVPVYLTGEIDGIPTIALATAANEDAATSVGLATHDIENNSFGYVTVQGIVFDVNTSGLTQGSRVHVAQTAGVLQTASPTYPLYSTDIGICLISDSVAGCIYVSPIQQHAESFRTSGDASFDGNVRIGGDLTILGSQSVISVTNLSVSDNIIYLNGGDAIGAENTTFTGTGLDDAYFTGYYEGNDAGTTYYVRIDSVGGGTGGVDTFEWSIDNFSTTEATGIDITAADQALSKNINIKFAATTGHTLNDTWSGTAAPSNVDIGFMGSRNTGATGIGYSHVGFFFDTADETFKSFSRYDPDPTSGNIDASDSSFTFGNIAVGNISCGTITGTSFSGTAATASALSSSRNFSIGGAVTAPAQSFNGTGNVTLTATLNSILSDLNNVSATTPTDGQVLTYNDSAGEWAPADPTGGTGGGGSFLPTKLDSITTVNGQGTYNLTVLSAPYTPSSVNALLVSLNGVTQAPGDAFTISGTTITFIPALATNDVVDFIIDLGAAVETVSTTEVDTLNSVTTRGSSTTNNISVGTLTSTSVVSTGAYTEQTFIVTGSTPTLDPANGTIQTWVLPGNSTPTENLADGQFITLHIDDGTAFTITWPTITWLGGAAPQLDTLNLTVVQLWKIGTTLYGAEIGVLG